MIEKKKKHDFRVKTQKGSLERKKKIVKDSWAEQTKRMKG